MERREIEVQRIDPGDGEVLKAIRLAALADAPFAFGSSLAREEALGADDWRARARLAAEGTERATFLAWADARAVGIVGGYRETDDEVHLVSMWTAPGARRTGVGRRLVAAVVDWAAETGARSVGLWVTDGNEPAQRLYASLGFAVTGDHQPLPSDPCRDEVRMRRPLG